MIRSMTGFGEALAHDNGAHYALELKSLNQKFFKSNIRLPERLQRLEPELEAALRKRVSRGVVTLTLKVSDTSENAAHEINTAALDRYVSRIREAFGDDAASADPGALLHLPGVLQPPPEDETRHEREREVVTGLLAKAGDALIAMREAEGEALAAELIRLHDAIAGHVERISELAPSVVEAYHERLRQRVEAMLRDAGATVDPPDLVREVAVYAERSDITEEITRLRGHLDRFKTLIATETEPVGRTLEFLAQEMLREANTIASKSGDGEVTHLAVLIKGEVDRIKEQSLNAE